MNLKDFSLYYVDKAYKLEYNRIKFGKNETKKHKLLKLEVCKFLIMKDLPFLTELKFRKDLGGNRADVISPLTDEIFECLVTETDKKFAEKKKFPKEFIVHKVFDEKNLEGDLKW